MDGLTLKIEGGERGEALLSRIWPAVCGALLYAALAGAACSMAYLSTAGLAALIPGGALALLLPLLPRRRGTDWALPLGGLLLAGVLFLLWRREALEGAKLLLNRLYAASEERQAYEYERFSVAPGTGLGELRRLLLPAGLVLGLLCGLGGRQRLPLLGVGLTLLYALGAGYLGVTPAAAWNGLLALALVLSFAGTRSAPGLMAPLLLCCAAALLLFPGEDRRLSAWEEGARDALALRTAAYVDPREAERPEATEPPAEVPDREFSLLEEPSAADTGGGEELWRTRGPLLLAVLIFALLLFVPAVLSDRLRKRRERNRAGLSDRDNAAAVRAGFLYAMRWLYLGGLPRENRPYAHSAPEIGERWSGALREEFEQVLPLWREAAYSSHALSGEQREAALRFAENARAAVWETLGKRERFRARYVEAL